MRSFDRVHDLRLKKIEEGDWVIVYDNNLTINMVNEEVCKALVWTIHDKPIEQQCYLSMN